MAKQSVLQGAQFKYIKGGMYALNILVAGLGLSLGGVGVWIRVDFNATEYKAVIDPVFNLCREVDSEFDFSINVHMDAIAYFFIFLGVAILCIGCVGTCGTIRERQTYIGMFSIFLYIVFAILLTSGIQAMTRKDVFTTCQQQMTRSIQTAVRQYDTVAAQQQFIDHVEKNLLCCGVTDMSRDTHCNQTKVNLPTCDRSIIDFFDSITDNMIMILVVSSSLGVLSIIGIGMSAYLFWSLRKAKLRM